MPKTLVSDPGALSQDIFSSSTVQGHPLGTRATDGQGQVYRYVKAGAADLVVGNVIQAPAQITTHDQLTPAAADAGAYQITVTLDITNAVVADQYKEGWAVIDTTPGLGYAYPIKSHPAAAASAAVVLTLERPVQVALTASSRVTLVPNRFKGVIQSPVTTLTGAVVGVAVYPIAAGKFGWIGTGGVLATLIAGTPAVGAAVVVPGTAAGCVVVDGATAATEVVGAMMVTGVDGKVLPVRWYER